MSPLKFSLDQFLKTGAQLGTASLEGALQGEAQQGKEQLQQLQQQRLLEQMAAQGDRLRLQQEGLGLRQDVFGLQQQTAANSEANRQRDDLRALGNQRRLGGDTEGAASFDARSMGGTGQRAALNPNEQSQLMQQLWQQHPTLPMTALADPQNRTPESIPGRYPFPGQGEMPGGEITAQPDIRKQTAATIARLDKVLAAGRTAVFKTPEEKQDWVTSSAPVETALAHGFHTPEELQIGDALAAHLEGKLAGSQPAVANVGIKEEAAKNKPLQDRLNKINTTLGNIGYLQRANPKMISALLTDGRTISDKLGVPFTVPDSVLTHMSEYERQHLGIMKQNADTSVGNLGLRSLDLQARIWRMQQIQQKNTGLSANAVLRQKMQSTAEAARDYHAEVNKPLNKYDNFDVDSFTGNPKDPNYTTARARIAHLYHIYKQRVDDVEGYIQENDPNAFSAPAAPPPPNWTPWQGTPAAKPAASAVQSVVPRNGGAAVQERPAAPTLGTQYQQANSQQQHQMRQELRNALERAHETRPDVIRRAFQHAFGVSP